jgi:malonate transporter and related proteins
VTAVFESLVPIFALILLGFALRWKGIVAEDQWRGVELLGYWVFFPALLSDTLIRADLQSLPISGVTITMVLTYATMATGILAARSIIMGRFSLGGPGFSSVFQNSTRWNGFIALPILQKLYGETGVALVAVVMGALVPLANFAAVYVVTQNANGKKPGVAETLYVVFRNPFIWATAIGLAINFGGVPIYAPVMSILNLLGGAAVGVGLLMVGAGLRVGDAAKPSPAVMLGTVLKLFGTPLLVMMWSLLTGLEGVAFVACMTCAAVPTAMSAYVMAKQMGGDAGLVASTVTVQTAVSFISIPLFITLAEWLR